MTKIIDMLVFFLYTNTSVKWKTKKGEWTIGFDRMFGIINSKLDYIYEVYYRNSN